MVFSILQWNDRSLIANGQEFKEYISKKESSPDIICVQETWLKLQLNFTLQGYTIIQKDRKLGNGGGVATFIKQGIGFRNIVRDVEQEVVVVEVWQRSQSHKVINFYNPCEKLSLKVLENIGGNIGDKVIWCGDFNAHSMLWGSNKSDFNGKIVEELLDLGKLVCINDGSNTRLDVSRGRDSALDLTLVSDNLAGKCEWKVMKHCTIGSDHFPIAVKIGVEQKWKT